MTSLKQQNISFKITILESFTDSELQYFLDCLNIIKLLKICKILIKYEEQNL